MIKREYGGTIPHLEPSHINKIPVPLLPKEAQQQIHKQISRAYYLRDEANELLDLANELTYKNLGLALFNEPSTHYFNNSIKPKSFTIRASELNERYDASFHLPIGNAIIEQLKQGRYPLRRLGDFCNQIFIPHRFKRIYVSAEHGTPFLQGSHLPLIKPYDLKYLSHRAHTDLSPYQIKKRWVLITRSGTVGRIAPVSKAMDGWVASEHILRLVPNNRRADAGFLAAFLSTPYGQHQLTSKIYGGVVDELTESDTAQVWVPEAPLSVQEHIGSLVIKAYEKKEKANFIEKDAIDRLEQILHTRKESLITHYGQA